MKTLRVTLADIIGPTGTPNSTATVHARYVDTSGRGRDVHLTDGTIVVPVRRVAAADGDPEVFDFDVYANDVAPVREVDYGHLVEVSWTVVAPTGAKTSGVRRVAITDSMASVVQLGLLSQPEPVAPYTGGYALAPDLAAEVATRAAADAALDGRVDALEVAPPAHTHPLSDVTDAGTAAAADVGDFATAAQGILADSATQPADLATVATTGAYADLTGKPTLGTAAAADVADLVAEVGVVSDPATAGLIESASETQTAGDARWAQITNITERDAQPVNVANYGFSRPSFVAALADAEARGRGTVMDLPAGVYDLGSGMPLSGKSVVLRGHGAHGTTNNPSGTVLHASSQAGPVLDFTGWVVPTPVFGAKVRHSDFLVRGSGAADPTKNNSGIRIQAINSTTFSDIAIRDTGGPCLDLVDGGGDSCYLNDFERIILNTPVNAGANDVPYLRSVESNGNRFRGIGLRSVLASGDVGPSGAVVFTGGPAYGDLENLFDGWWFEYLHVPNGGTLFAHAGSSSVISDFQFFDVGKETGAAGTSYFRLTNPPAVGRGGNLIRGVIPGKGTNSYDIDMGIDIQQSGNRVDGVKGYKGTNVVIAAGVGLTDVQLGGSIAAATDPAVIDNSGLTTNTWRDYTLGTEGGRGWQRDVSGSIPRFYNAVTPANGDLGIGQGGVLHRAVGAALYMWQDQLYLRTIAGAATPVYLGSATNAPSIRTGTGSPEGSVAAVVGSLYLRSDGGAGTSHYVKESGAGYTGWVAK